MHHYLYSGHYDLTTPDGQIISLEPLDEQTIKAEILIDNISPNFVGYKIPQSHLLFNTKSTLAQLGINGIAQEIVLDLKSGSARVNLKLTALGQLAKKMLPLFKTGQRVGKLFAADERRRVRDPDYLLRMFGRLDHKGSPLLSLGNSKNGDELVLEKIDGFAVAHLALKKGVVVYDPQTEKFLPTLAKALSQTALPTRDLLQLHQIWKPEAPRIIKQGEVLLVKTLPLHIRTVFGRVLSQFLPEGYHHTTASILEPTTEASGDIYELFGSSNKEIEMIPLGFYTLEPHREHVFFADRDQLQQSLEKPEKIFKAFSTAPLPLQKRAAVYIVKGEQMQALNSDDWIARETHPNTFPGLIFPEQQSRMVEQYIEQQPCYPFLKAIEQGIITSEGVLLTRYFPTPLMKKMLLNDPVQHCLKAIYFQIPSLSYGDYFSHEDRTTLLDLAKFAIPVFWVDKTSGNILQYIPRPDKDSGMFVPEPNIETFMKAIFFGVYGSNLIEGNYEEELSQLLLGLLNLRDELSHPLFNNKTPIALVTGGGPGVMEVGNRVAKKLQILSCANIVDFARSGNPSVHEQKHNPYIDAKMTYRIDRLVERQMEFNLDFPIIVNGGIGTDFEYALEEVRRKVGKNPTPVLLFGTPDYWKEKITSRFQCNLANGTIAGSEWISNCFYCVQNAAQGLQVYKNFFENRLKIGPNGPISKNGFTVLPTN